MGIKETDACDSSVSGAEKRLDVGVWFGVLALLSLLASRKTSHLFKQLENLVYKPESSGLSCTTIVTFCTAFGSEEKKRAAGF